MSVTAAILRSGGTTRLGSSALRAKRCACHLALEAIDTGHAQSTAMLSRGGGTSGARVKSPEPGVRLDFYDFQDTCSLILERSDDSVSKRNPSQRETQRATRRGPLFLRAIVATNLGAFERKGTWWSSRIFPLETLGARTRCASLICLRDSSLDATRLFEWTRIVCVRNVSHDAHVRSLSYIARP